MLKNRTKVKVKKYLEASGEEVKRANRRSQYRYSTFRCYEVQLRINVKSI
jgi:hypothetical protein